MTHVKHIPVKLTLHTDTHLSDIQNCIKQMLNIIRASEFREEKNLDDKSLKK